MTRNLDPVERLARYGPTTGDRVRLADTELWIRVEADRQAPGDEPIWGYAKTLRPSMTQAGRATDSELDAVVAGALVVDPTIGIVKADIGIKDGRIVGVGRAGNPAISDGIELEIGPHTAPIMGYGLIATPGAVDSHVHLISPALMPAALSGGVTTLISAGFEEPPWAMERTLAAMTGWPLNIGIQACARSEASADFEALLDAGAVGFKIHEDYGANPALIDATLRFADAAGVAVALHTDGLHETAELEDTIAAIAGRTVHAYHVEGTGGGHAPDLLGLVREANIICSSTTPTIPFGVNAAAEHIAMIVLNHGGSMGLPGDVALAAGRIHPATMAAEGPLHDLGAIQIINSDSQGMGRIMETVRRSFQLASVLTRWRGSTLKRGLDPDGLDEPDDNERVLQYLAKVTIEPAITHGLADHVGSLRAGRLADIVLWKPAWFGAKPELVLKSGVAAWGPLGEGNATVERAEPTRYRADWGGSAGLAPRLGVTFVSEVAAGNVRRRSVGGREVVPIGQTRGLTRADLWLNRATASVQIDVTDGHVTLDDRALAIDPVGELPLSRRYFLR
ncbi:MAG: urease subunit alpha [Chloroflexota bacterium]|nr:urease subunit alpha [Chloroflexota bacterium]